tara:strand:- start:11 stop:142 length:132 start_codon:yes stop_codon:yes gene_type:complete
LTITTAAAAVAARPSKLRAAMAVVVGVLLELPAVPPVVRAAEP